LDLGHDNHSEVIRATSPVSNPGVQDRENDYGSDAIAASGVAILSTMPAAGKI